MPDTLLINNILNATSERKATDIHMVAGSNPVIRVGGRLMTMTEQPVLTPDNINSISEIFLSSEELEQLNKEREVVSVYTWADKARFKAKLFYQKGFLAISLRMIPAVIHSPKELNIPVAITQLLNKDRGLLIITGPFSSGRTTTAASLLETINQNKGVHIQTLEDPIEYLFINNQSIIEQRQVGRDTPSFIKGLQDMMDEDVDVAMISNVHEKGMEELILELSESGKLVIIIMDADSVESALERFIIKFSSDKRKWAKDLLADSLLGAVAQRLVPRVGGGLSLVCEVLTSIPAVRSSIKDEKFQQLTNIMQSSKQEGMTSMDRALFELVKIGEVDVKDAISQANDPQTFRLNFR
mgnify:CR=1 FL=1|jgi:twitching motility protein PilT